MLPKTKQLQSLLNDLGRSKILLTPELQELALNLVGEGADFKVCATTLDYKTLVHHLVLTNKSGNNESVLIALSSKDPNIFDIRDGYGCSVLMSLIDQVQRKKCTPEDFKRTAMFLARNGAKLHLPGTVDACNTLLHHFILDNKDGQHNAEIIELLEKDKSLVRIKNGHRQTALVSLLDQLQSRQCSLEDFKRTALLLARFGADLSECSSIKPSTTLIHHLVLGNQDGANNKAITDLLQINPAIFTVLDGEGNLPLHALLSSQPNLPVSAIERLVVLAGKGVLTYKNPEEVTLLHKASTVNNLKVAMYVVDQGIAINAKSKSGNTALHCAVEHGDEQFLLWLLTNGVDINAQNAAGQTALHLAVQQNNKNMVEWLINHIAFLYTLDSQGKSALDCAEEKGNQEIKALLLQAQDNPIGHLFAAVTEIKKYGLVLKDKAAPKGQIAIDLAAGLWSKAETFFKQGKPTVTAQLPQFQAEFSALLHSKNKEMSQYRASWSTIISNVLIALTGLGLLLIAAKLVHSKLTEGRPLFFFQKPQTTSEEKLIEAGDKIHAIKTPN